MILSRPSKFFLFIGCLAVAEARAADVDLGKAIGSLIAAEKAYAKLAGEKGFCESDGACKIAVDLQKNAPEKKP
jgi:hypothetical protein